MRYKVNLTNIVGFGIRAEVEGRLIIRDQVNMIWNTKYLFFLNRNRNRTKY